MREIMKKKWNDSRWQIIGVLTCWVLGCLVYLLFAGQFDHEQYHDATRYWNIGRSLWEKGHFDFSNAEIFRGYFFPVYLGICNQLCGWGDGTAVFALINSLLISLWFVLLLPRLHGSSVNSGRRYMACIVTWGLFNFFFFGLTVYPLSDLFAIMVCSLSIVVECGIEKTERGGGKTLFTECSAGSCCLLGI